MSITIHNHRDGTSEYCPFCNFKQDGLGWLRCKTDIFDSSKKDKMVVLSECPSCFEKSWSHYRKEALQVINIMEMELYVNNV